MERLKESYYIRREVVESHAVPSGKARVGSNEVCPWEERCKWVAKVLRKVLYISQPQGM